MLQRHAIGLIAVAISAAVCGGGCDRSATKAASNQAMVGDVATPPAAQAPAAAITPAAPSPTPIPYPNTNVAPRDPSTGQATGRRMYKPTIAQ